MSSTSPLAPKPPAIPKEIQGISSQFNGIFAQSSAAEQLGLGQLAGVGYRKALEFLIKDYCIKLHPTKEEDIKKCFLGKCIVDYVDDPKVKQCAQRAAWLGNDETHYVRTWLDRDVRDLKILIELTMAWIRNVVLTEQYGKAMKT